MNSWIIEPLSTPDEIDAILAIEQASFTNPWTREMYVAELKNAGVSFFYLARDKGRQIVGFCSVWRVLDELHIQRRAKRRVQAEIRQLCALSIQYTDAACLASRSFNDGRSVRQPRAVVLQSGPCELRFLSARSCRLDCGW